MSYLLHIDTATDTGTVAVSANGLILATRTNTEMRNHAATINLMIQDALAEAGCSLQQLSAVAICSGPGSYTGLRIGMATAKGLCYALDIPLIAADRLTLLAYQTWLQHKDGSAVFISLITARVQEYFIAGYDAGFKSILAPQHILESQIAEMTRQTENIFMVSDAQPEIFKELNINTIAIITNTIIDNNAWAKYAIDQFECSDIQILASAEPTYLKQVYTHK